MNISASWRVAFRAAYRIVRSHPFRSLLIAALIALPVFGLSAYAVFSATASFSDDQRLDWQIGNAPAAVMVPSDARQLVYTELLDFGIDATSTNNTSEKGVVLGTGNVGDNAFVPTDAPDVNAGEITVAPGYATADPWTTERVEATVDSHVVATRFATTSLEAGNVEFPAMEALFADASDPLLGNSVHLLSGRWPTAANEVAISALAVESGTPSSGTIDIRLGLGLPKQTFDIVGVGDASIGTTLSVYQTVAVFALEAAPEDAGWRWFVDRDDSVALDEATDIAASGLTVISRDIGPADDELSVDARTEFLYKAVRIGITTTILLLAVALAAPAFAISATERRRDLALLHAQGASPSDLRRHVLAYGALLTGVSTVGAAIVGSGAMYFYLRSAVPVGQEWFSPIEMPWLTVTLGAAAAFVSAMVAAWLPARSVIRSAALPTARVERTARQVVKAQAIASAVVLALGIFLLAEGSKDPESSSVLILGIALTAVAGLTGIPPLLVWVGRWSRRGPVAARMALSDISRYRSRSTPAVAAIASVVGILLVGLSTLLADRGLFLPEILVVLTVVAVIALAATLIVTALATSYNKDVSTTLDTIGASTSMRRAFAGSYAAGIAGIGAAVGSVFGLTIGWACATWTITTQELIEFPDPEVPDAASIPWMWLAIVVVLPVLAYGLAWITVRPTSHKEADQPEMSMSR